MNNLRLIVDTWQIPTVSLVDPNCDAEVTVDDESGSDESVRYGVSVGSL